MKQGHQGILVCMRLSASRSSEHNLCGREAVRLAKVKPHWVKESLTQWLVSYKKERQKPGGVAHAFNPSAEEAESGRSL